MGVKMLDRNLAMEFVRVTEFAAIASARLMGRGDEKAADQAAVDAMRKSLDHIFVDGTVVIGEGERDEAPMLYIGEKVGNGKGPKVDIALDPLEGTTICAKGGFNALSVIAIAEEGCFLHSPDTYMEKIAVGPVAKNVVSLQQTPTENLKAIAKAKGVDVDHVTAIILDRERHNDLIKEVRASGARIRLIGDGDVSAAIATCWKHSGIDVLFGSGGAPEGVIAAAALKCVGGYLEGKLNWRNDEEKERGKKMGITDLEKLYTLNELAKGEVMFAATGVTTGDFLKGVRFFPGGAVTQSVVMRSKTGTIRNIEANHFYATKPLKDLLVE
jgi:fructose-1,6-bisphosphatase class II